MGGANAPGPVLPSCALEGTARWRRHAAEVPGSVPPPTDAALRRVRALVLEHGWNSTAYQILNPGMCHWFSAEGDAVVGYVDAAGTSVVAGAPVCAPARLAAVAAEFEAAAAGRGKGVCYFAAESRLESLYAGSPTHRAVLLGAQPVWDPAGWAARVARHASMRGQLNRARNKAVSVVEWPAARAAADARLDLCLREWLATRGLPPLHFLIEPATLDRLFDRRVFVAERAGTPVGFLVASPVPARNGWLFEQFVRGHAAPNGTVESMIDGAMRAIAAEGYAYVTLGLAPLSSHAPPPRQANPLWLRAVLGWVRAHGRRFYNFGGLDDFKAKLDPERWEPVYAISAAPSFSPRALYAIAGAFSRGAPARLLARGIAAALRSEGRRVLQHVRRNAR